MSQFTDCRVCGRRLIMREGSGVWEHTDNWLPIGVKPHMPQPVKS